MSHILIQNYHQANRTQGISTIQRSQASMSIIIEELRKQNELLKRQISHLELQTGNQNNKVPQNSVTNYAIAINNIENSFRTKMSKFMQNKLSKKSFDQYQQTLASSFKQSHLHLSNKKGNQKVLYNKTNSSKSPNLKMIEVQSYKTVNNAIDKEEQYNMKNDQKTNNATIKAVQENKKINAKSKNYQKSQSSKENNHKFESDKTHRLFNKYNEQKLNQSLKNTSKQKNKQTKLQIEPLLLQKIIQQNIKPSFQSPKRNAYFQEIEDQQNVKPSQSQSKLPQLGNYRISIQQHLQEKQSACKLRCNIYLQKEKQEQ